MPRLLISALLAAAVALPTLAATAPAPVAASSTSCTGWQSKLNPPRTIRVGRASGAVDEVDFRTYVGRVMAKEWNLSNPEVLQTAAVAVKQYAWYYALAGNWRKSYVNAAGECFDVKDSTADQIYRSDVDVLPRIWAAVDATWGLSVRKSDRFFLTGYRTGVAGTACGADATGYRLYAKSVIQCGKDGLTREQIQLIYYAPDLTFHWASSDAVASEGSSSLNVALGRPDVELLSNIALGGTHARISWDAASARGSGMHYQVQHFRAGAWREVALTDPTARSIDAYLKPGATHAFRVRLRDAKGNVGSWYGTGKFKPRLVQNGNTTGILKWSAGWSRLSTTKASGGSVGVTTKVGSSVSVEFSGRSIAIVGTRGPSHGIVRVYVDGKLDEEIDLYAGSNRWRQLVYSRNWERSGQHTVRLELVGAKGRTTFHFDAALIHP